MKKILMIVGSFRKNSFNMQLALTAKEMLADKAEVNILQYEDRPFFNQDIETPTPESIERIRRQVMDADGIWIFTPEYNSQIPGVLKNLLDWLSRPVVPGDWKRGSAVRGKAVTIAGVAGKSAAANARANLKELLGKISMNVMGDTGTGFYMNHIIADTGMLQLSEENLRLLKEQAENFVNAI
ncbi:MAG: NAD(P)H-dependent oxidoreductase [Oscillospiraceae bacterium]|nr:NAD(P)H-dependent oxidoreductase [Oscillospiraceae bacterium]